MLYRGSCISNAAFIAYLFACAAVLTTAAYVQGGGGASGITIRTVLAKSFRTIIHVQ